MDLTKQVKLLYIQRKQSSWIETKQIKQEISSGFGSVDRAVASNTRGPRIQIQSLVKFIEHLFTVNCVEKTKIKNKEAVNGPIFLIKQEYSYASPYKVSECTLDKP